MLDLSKVNVHSSIQHSGSIWKQYSPVLLAQVAKINSALKSIESFTRFGTSRLMDIVSKGKYLNGGAESHFAQAKTYAQQAGIVGWAGIAFAMFALGLIVSHLRRGNQTTLFSYKTTFTPQQIEMINRRFANTPYQFNDLPVIKSENYPTFHEMSSRTVMRGTMIVYDTGGPDDLNPAVRTPYSYITIGIKARKDNCDQAKHLIIRASEQTATLTLALANTFEPETYKASCDSVKPLLVRISKASEMNRFLQGESVFDEEQGIEWSILR